MKNATPKDSRPVKVVVKYLDNLNHQFIKSLTSHSPYDKKPDEYFVQQFLDLKDRVIQLYDYHFFDEKGLDKLQKDIFVPIETMTNFDVSIFSLSVDGLKKILEKKISKSEKIVGVVTGLEKPVRWEDISIIYGGYSVKIKQCGKFLGEYSLSDIGIPEPSSKKGGVAKLFLLLFLANEMPQNQLDALVSTNNNNQANKSNLSKILRSAFQTNAKPIKIDRRTKFYTAVFKATNGGDLKLNEYYSGASFYDSLESSDRDSD